ncbi:MAG: PqqD family protein [Eubacterium sp.]|nr:PqqD family protein [Eubacterium sp.]
MKINKGFAKREIAGSYIVVPVGKKSLEFNGMITLNESGSFMWDCFAEGSTIEEAVKKVTDEYEVDEQTARKDIEKFVSLLKKNNLISD